MTTSEKCERCGNPLQFKAVKIWPYGRGREPYYTNLAFCPTCAPQISEAYAKEEDTHKDPPAQRVTIK